jgi:hypothetical protein
MSDEVIEDPEFAGHVDRGEVVFWYRHAVTTRSPMLALVQESYGGEMDLTVIGHASLDSKTTTPHLSSPRIKIKNGVVSPVATESGCWDFRTPEQREKFWPSVSTDVDALPTDAVDAMSTAGKKNRK